MSFLTKSFITATDVEGYETHIATDTIAHIHGICTEDQYDTTPLNRVKIFMNKEWWWTGRETPEQVIELIQNAQINALKDLYKTRLPIQPTADLLNAYAKYKTTENHCAYISIDYIEQLYNQTKNYKSVIKTMDGDKIHSITPMEEIMKSITIAQKQRLDTIRQCCLGVA